MQLQLPPHLAFGSCPGSLNPPQISGAFFVKGTLQLKPGETAVWADEPESVIGDVYADDDPAKPLRYASDFAVFKPRADILLVGHAFAPEGRPAETLSVRFGVGKFSKAIDVAGDRTWQGGVLTATRFSPPKPFVKMSLGYDAAYGGPGFDRNPVGKGHRSEQAPNVTLPGRPEATEPVGFGPIPPSWPERHGLVGTYRGNYVKERWPWFPKDFDWGYFNAAPKDQQIEGYLRGDEEISLENLHPEQPVLRCKLPGVRIRCFLEDLGPNGERRFREVPLNLDTLWIDTDTAKLILVWRGNADVRTPKMREIDAILVASEPLTERPRPAAEYQAALKKPGAVPVPPPEPPTPGEEAFKKAFVEFDLQMAASEQKFVAMEKELAAADAELEKTLAKLPAGVTLPTVPADQTLSDFAAELEATLTQLRQNSPASAEHIAGIDPGELKGLDGEMTALRQEMEQMRVEMTPPITARWTRERVQDAAKAKESLREQDLSGLDLSELDLMEVDFSRSVLSGANLEGAKLAKANLTGVDLTSGNLGKTDLTGAILDDADFTDAILKDAKLTGVSLHRTTLTGVNLAGADISGCTGKEPHFAKGNLAGAKFVGAKLPAADFSGCNLAKAVFTDAELITARFEGAKAKEIDFSGAKLQGIHADEKADFSFGRFNAADASKAIFDTSNFDGANFSRANLASAQFEGASLRETNFDRANLTGAMFDDAGMQKAALTNANFLRVSLEGVDLTGANATGANFYEAGFWRAATDGVEFRNANRKSTLLG